MSGGDPWIGTFHQTRVTMGDTACSVNVEILSMADHETSWLSEAAATGLGDLQLRVLESELLTWHIMCDFTNANFLCNQDSLWVLSRGLSLTSTSLP